MFNNITNITEIINYKQTDLIAMTFTMTICFLFLIIILITCLNDYIRKKCQRCKQNQNKIKNKKNKNKIGNYAFFIFCNINISIISDII